MASRTDTFQSPDYFLLDELLTDEQKLVRETVRNYVKKEISPIIEDYAQRAVFPEFIVKLNWASWVASVQQFRPNMVAVD